MNHKNHDQLDDYDNLMGLVNMYVTSVNIYVISVAKYVTFVAMPSVVEVIVGFGRAATGR